MKLSGFVNQTTFLKYIRRHHIESKHGRYNRKMYSRARMLQVARDRKAAEERRRPHPTRDPVNDPIDSGDLAAKAYELFNASTPLITVAIQLRLPGPEVERLFEQWWRLGQRSQNWLEGKPSTTQTPPMHVPPIDPAVAAAVATAATSKIASPPTAPPDPPHQPAADGSCCVKHTLEFVKEKGIVGKK